MTRGGVVIAAALLLGTSTDARAQLAPHRAFYELSLAEMHGFLAEARGAFAVEWQDVCEGFTSSQRLWFVARTEEGGTFDYDVRFSTWESADNTQMRFAMRSFAGGRLVEEVKGSAMVPADGGPGRAIYSEPSDLELALPPDTVFPRRHMDALIEAARRGERVVTYDLFDGAGTGDDALASVTAVIGDPFVVAAPPTDGERAWPMALAYYEMEDSGGLGVPVFELSFDVTTRGVMRRALLDYGDFALTATLDELEMLKPSACE